ncbi:MAG TPA: hypothetical protein VGO55_07130 [Allosphingosinicella sp.]|jgi:hypothetical protein|nr:hypothetical protein [Allosphingosinicella sp.]
MRRLVVIFASIALGASAPALADITLRYRVVIPQTAPPEARQNAPTMTIDADDAGHARIEMSAPAGAAHPPGAPPAAAGDRAPSVALITREGVGYLALRGPQAGQELVAPQDDALALMTPLAAGMASGSAQTGVQEMMRQRIEVLPVREETVAGLRGQVYSVVVISGETRSPPVEIVVSNDPRLAPAGRELVRLVESLGPTFVTVMGGEPPVYGAIRTLLGHGTPVRIGDFLVLDSFDTNDIPDSRFALPGPILTREQLGQIMGAMAGGRAPGAEGPPPQVPPAPRASPPPPLPPPAGTPPPPQ